MKKSFLSRAMSAAIAVPVALSQTVMFTSFAVDENAVNASALQTITIEDFKQVPVKDTNLSPITEVEKYAVYEKTSTWNSTLKGWTNTQVGQKFRLDTSKLADTITSEAWYVEILKDAMSNPDYTSAEAEVGLDDITVTVNVNYPYADAMSKVLEKKMAEKYPNMDMNFDSDGMLSGTVVLKASTDALDDSKIPFEVVLVRTDDTEKTSMTLDEFFNYVENMMEKVREDANSAVDNKVKEYQAQKDEKQSQLDEAVAAGLDTTTAQAELDKAQAQLDDAEAMAQGEVDSIVDTYLNKVKKSREKVNSLKDEYTKEYTGSDIDAIIQQVKADAEAKLQSQADRIENKIPDTIDEFASTNIYAQLVKMYVETMNQINDQVAIKAYEVDLNADDILEFAKEIQDVTVTGQGTKTAEGYGSANGTATGSLPEVLTADDLAYYYDYFNDLFAADNKKVVEGSIKTEKVIEATGNMTSDTLTGEATLEIKRIITLDVEDLEETTTSDSNTSETTTDSNTSETTTDSNTSETTTDSNTSETTTDSNTSETTTDSNTSETTTDSNTSETTTDSNTSETTTDSNTSETTTTSDSNVTETTTTSETTVPVDVNVKDIRFEVDGDVDGNRNFYFSHDPRPFEVADLIKSAKVQEVTTVEGEDIINEIDVDMSKIAFGLDSSAPDADLSPLDVVNEIEAKGQEFAYTLTPLYIFYEDAVAETQVYVYIGVKGDATLDGVANAEDAAEVLTYAAAIGAGNEAYIKSETNQAQEAFAWFLSDVTSESRDMGETSNVEGEATAALNSEDAAYILTYAAVFGTKGSDTDWVTDVLNPDNDASVVLPKFTKAIYDWKVENAK